MLFAYLDHGLFRHKFFCGVKFLDYVSVNFLSALKLMSCLTIPYILFFFWGLKILLSLFMFHVFVLGLSKPVQ